MNPESILRGYGLTPSDYEITPITAGYINKTFKLTGAQSSYVLQRVNKNIFRQPEIIASNIRHAAEYLKLHHPDYRFLNSVPTTLGKEMFYDEENYPWRLFPFIENTITVNRVEHEAQAYRGARGFASLTKNLHGCHTKDFHATIDRFHDLNLRYQQFETALQHAAPDRLLEAQGEIVNAKEFFPLVQHYDALIRNGSLPERIMHNDTKINNILFDAHSGEAVCVIDLDTLMPGYFIYDLGDMIRTFVSPVDEEEQDLGKVIIRKDIFDAVVKGYVDEMGSVLTDAEMEAIPFSGKMMTYIMALRMLADFLNGDVYYQTTYPRQNLIRARNQFRLLKQL